MYVQETNSWPEFLARAKKVGSVSYKKITRMSPVGKPDNKITMEPIEIGSYSVKDEDESGPRQMVFTTYADGDNAKYLTQLKIAGIKLGPNVADSQQDANDLRLAQLETRVSALETQIQELSNPSKRAPQRKKK